MRKSQMSLINFQDFNACISQKQYARWVFVLMQIHQPLDACLQNELTTFFAGRKRDIQGGACRTIRCAGYFHYGVGFCMQYIPMCITRVILAFIWKTAGRAVKTITYDYVVSHQQCSYFLSRTMR